MHDVASSVATLEEVLDAHLRLVEGVRPEQWSAPTPCPEWDVRRLVEHMVTGNRMFTLIAGGAVVEGPDGLQELRARVRPAPGDDPVVAFRASARALVDAVSQPGFRDGRYPTPLGELDGGRVVMVRVTETLVHGWDLARATGQSPTFPAEVVEAVLQDVRVSLAGRPRASWLFAPEQPAQEGAAPLDRFAAFLGRPLSARRPASRGPRRHPAA